MRSWRRRTAVFVLVGDVFAAAGGVFPLTAVRSARADLREPQSTCQTSIMTADDAGPSNQFGWSVAIGGDFAFIGANLGKDNSQNITGSVYVFKRDGVPWVQRAELLASGASANDEFGGSVAASADLLIVGAPHDEEPGGQNNIGVAYIFELVGQNWVEDTVLTAKTHAQAGAAFGDAVAIDGDRLIVGAPERDNGGINNTGEANFFERQPDGTWKRLTPDAAPTSGAGDKFGGSVGISGDWAIIGAQFTDEACPQVNSCNSGSAFIYRREVTTSVKWRKHATLLPPALSESQGYRFGSSVAIAGNIAVVGAMGTTGGLIGRGNEGAAYVFRRNDAGTPGELTDDVWEREATLADQNALPDEFFGHSVAISGDTIIVGAFGRNSNTGAAYLYRPGEGGWAQVDMVTAVDPNAFAFGWAVATNGDHAMVGAYPTDSLAGAAYALRISLGDDCDSNGLPDECDIHESSGGPCVGDIYDPDTNPGGVCYADDNQNGIPDILACECQTDGDCDDGLACTTGSCDPAMGRCTFIAVQNKCAIDGACFDDDEANPANPVCQFCNATADAFNWSNAFDDTSCGAGEQECSKEVCLSGACATVSFDSGTPCGDAAGSACHDPDTCDGAGACVDNTLPQGTQCRAQATECDVAEACDGVSHDCPADGFVAANTPCDDGNPCTCNDTGACVVVDRCDGNSAVCQAGEDPCPTDLVCNPDGQGGYECLCGEDAHCEDGEFCNGTDTCGPDSRCDHSGDPCPAGTVCDPDAPGNEAQACVDCLTAADCPACPDDARNCACTEAPTCTAGQVCDYANEPDGTPNCGDDTDNDCTNPDTCDGAGRCQPNHAPVGTPCPDHLYCNGEETCLGATCTQGEPPCPQHVCNEETDECSPGACCFVFGSRFGDATGEHAIVEMIFLGYELSDDGNPGEGVCFDEVPKEDCILIGGGFLGYGLMCDGDPDGDGAHGCDDGCPLDANKVEPGICGCGISDDNSDGDDFADCIDWCPDEPGPVHGCPAIGACCFLPAGVCIDRADPTDCVFVGGVYQGHVSSCDDGCIFPGDFDGDADIDLVDADLFADCLTGPAGTLVAGCEAADADHDNDVDLGDFATVQNLFTGDLMVCGDGIVQLGEECDDGNTASGDGCDGHCRIENDG